jgi:hypothetical protein
MFWASAPVLHFSSRDEESENLLLYLPTAIQVLHQAGKNMQYEATETNCTLYCGFHRSNGVHDRLANHWWLHQVHVNLKRRRWGHRRHHGQLWDCRTLLWSLHTVECCALESAISDRYDHFGDPRVVFLLHLLGWDRTEAADRQPGGARKKLRHTENLV